MVLIPIGSEFTSTLRGRTVKRVDCEQCRAQYAYVVRRSAKGAGMSILWLDDAGASGRAEGRARTAVRRALARAVEPVACPSCGWYQKEMVREARRRRGKWFVIAAYVAGGFAAFCLILALLVGGLGASGILGVLIVAGAAVAGAALLARHLRCTEWNPNADESWKHSREGIEEAFVTLAEEADATRAEAEE